MGLLTFWTSHPFRYTAITICYHFQAGKHNPVLNVGTSGGSFSDTSTSRSRKP